MPDLDTTNGHLEEIENELLKMSVRVSYKGDPVYFLVWRECPLLDDF